MSDESQTLCTNCQRHISSSNFQMHVVHCHRNIQLCPKCQEPVARSGLENHDLEYHSQVKCPDCHSTLESSKLDEHKENMCRKRRQPCKHCDLELNQDQMWEHENYCGSRTECCEICNKIVMFKYQEMHVESNHRKTKPDEDEFDNISDDDDVFFVNEYNNRGPNTQRGINGVNQQWRREFGDLGEYLRNLELNHTRNSARVRSNVVQNAVNLESIFVPCEFCSALVDADELIEHETGCRPDLTSAPKAMSESQHGGEKHTNLDGYEEGYQGNILIPCEFCHKPFSLDYFDGHQPVNKVEEFKGEQLKSERCKLCGQCKNQFIRV